jgi:hypothetical protein
MTTRGWTLMAAFLLLLAVLAAGWQQAQRVQAVALTPTLTGQVEYCLSCHAELPEISAAHPLETFGCVLCHGGERLALEADLAHSTMRGGRNPSEFSVVEASCGGEDCHSGPTQANRDHIWRAMSSIQSTYAGAIASIRYTFGAQPDLSPRFAVSAIQDELVVSPLAVPALETFDPAQESQPPIQKFGENCLGCHLEAEALPGSAYARLTGCAACHTPTAGLDITSGVTQLHRLTTSIAYTQCNTCHNRGNYNLRTMTFEERDDQPADRLHDYYQPIAQFVRCEWTLDCIDCHTRLEAMGDGDLYGSKKDIQYTQCRTCHGTLDELPLTRTITSLDDLALRQAFLNPVLDLKLGDTILVTDKDEALWNVRRLADGSYELFGKANGQRFTFNPVMGSGCQQNPAEQESRYCHQCHAVER